MNRTLSIVMVLLLLTLAGCRSEAVTKARLAVSNPTFTYEMIRQERRNARNEAKYNDAVGEHAREGLLLGTWTRTDRLEVLGQRLKDKWAVHTLSLFADNTYAYLYEHRGPVKQVALYEGVWAKQAPGVIKLDGQSVEAYAVPREIVLSDWTDTFAEQAKSLHKADEAESEQTRESQAD